VSRERGNGLVQITFSSQESRPKIANGLHP
jgi:hypothetical protein